MSLQQAATATCSNFKIQYNPTRMKLKTLLTLVATLALGANFAVADDDETPLSKEMSSMNRTLRSLKRQATDMTKKAENLALIEKVKGNLAAMAKYEPRKTKEQPAADKPAYVEKFKQQIAGLTKAVDELKAAVEKGEEDAIAAGFEKLSELKEKGHNDFGADC